MITLAEIKRLNKRQYWLIRLCENSLEQIDEENKQLSLSYTAKNMFLNIKLYHKKRKLRYEKRLANATQALIKNQIKLNNIIHKID